MTTPIEQHRDESRGQYVTRMRLARGLARFGSFAIAPVESPPGTFRWWTLAIGDRVCALSFGVGEVWIDEGYSLTEPVIVRRRFTVGKRMWMGELWGAVRWADEVTAAKRGAMAQPEDRERLCRDAGIERGRRRGVAQLEFNKLLTETWYAAHPTPRHQAPIVTMVAHSDGTATFHIRHRLTLAEARVLMDHVVASGVLPPVVGG